jgi:glycosyltransferase involved in cell wall biosynthesis
MNGNMRASAESTVSVIVPLYNGARFLGEALESVAVQLQGGDEIVVVDDGSEDDGPGIAARFPRARLVRKAHGGIGDTLNHGLRAARGEVVAFVDSDDRWAPGTRALQMAALAGGPPHLIVFSHMRNFATIEEGGAPRESTLAIVPGVIRTNMMTSRAVFDLMGPFTSDPGKDEFIAWYSRAVERGLPSHVIPRALYDRRVHENNYTRVDLARLHGRYFSSLKEVLQRRRAVNAAGNGD